MANTKSNLVAALDSGDQIAPQRLAGEEHVRICEVNYAALAPILDTATLCRIGIDELITSIRLWSDDVGTAGDIDVGFHEIGEGNVIGTVIDLDALGTAIDVNTAVLANVEIRFETKDITTINDRVWELAGLSDRPDYGECYLSINWKEASTAAADLIFVVRTVK